MEVAVVSGEKTMRRFFTLAAVQAARVSLGELDTPTLKMPMLSMRIF